ncbi:hypothetical protein [Listeria ilorinensis]|uniref:hypothetical protein n=1 Tax=Listeria ilorinensis TaxID=2867439 RepID=UPI001EF5EE98|nr:hypothetical protein [Listeria ilorinensis]
MNKKRVIILTICLLLSCLYFTNKIYKQHQSKIVSVTHYPVVFTENFLYNMNFNPTLENSSSYQFTKADKLQEVSFENVDTIRYKEKNGSSHLEVELGEDLNTHLALFKFIVKNQHASEISLNFSLDEIQIQSPDIRSLTFALVSNKRTNELSVNPPKNPEYHYFTIATDAEKVTLKPSDKRNKNGYQKWQIYIPESSTPIKTISAY